MSSLILWFVANLLGLGLFVTLLCAALEGLDKKVRMKFEKKEHESVVPDDSQGG